VRAAALFSGGKDSSYSILLAEESGIEVTDLIIVRPERDSMMFHYPCIEAAEIAAELMGKKHVTVEVSRESEEEMREVGDVLKSLGAEVLVSGAIASSYQKRRIERLCDSLGIQSFTPLWGRDPFEVLEEMLKRGFEIMIIGCFAEGMSKDFLGRVIDEEFLNLLRELNRNYKIHPAGEGGEFETLVLSAPHMKGRLKVDYDIFWRGDSGYVILKEITVFRGDSWRGTRN